MAKLPLSTVESMNVFDGGTRMVGGVNGTAGIFATYPADYLDWAGGMGDQVGYSTHDEHAYCRLWAHGCWQWAWRQSRTRAMLKFHRFWHHFLLDSLFLPLVGYLVTDSVINSVT